MADEDRVFTEIDDEILDGSKILNVKSGDAHLLVPKCFLVFLKPVLRWHFVGRERAVSKEIAGPVKDALLPVVRSQSKTVGVSLNSPYHSLPVRGCRNHGEYLLGGIGGSDQPARCWNIT